MSVEPLTPEQDLLVVEHLPFAEHLARRSTSWAMYGYDIDDLIASAQLGLVNAARTWDPQRGVPFRNWARLRIRAAMIDDLRGYVGASVRAARRRGQPIQRPESLDVPVLDDGGGDTPGERLVDSGRSTEATVELVAAIEAGQRACRDQLDRDILGALLADRTMTEVADAHGYSVPGVTLRAGRLRDAMRKAAA